MSKPFWIEFAELPVESQTQPDELYSEFPNLADKGRKRREAIAVFDVMVRLARRYLMLMRMTTCQMCVMLQKPRNEKEMISKKSCDFLSK